MNFNIRRKIKLYPIALLVEMRKSEYFNLSVNNAIKKQASKPALDLSLLFY